jgi:hypothetical protein
VMVSMESPEAETFRRIRGGSLAKVIRGIETLVAARDAKGADRPAVGLALTVFRSLEHELPRIAELYDRLGLDGGLALQGLNRMDAYARRYDEALAAETFTRSEEQAMWARLQADPQVGPLLEPGAHPGFWDALLEGFDPGQRRCPWLERAAYVGFNGAVKACCLMKDDRSAFGYVGVNDPVQLDEGRDEMRRMLRDGEVPSWCNGCEIATLITEAPPLVQAFAPAETGHSSDPTADAATQAALAEVRALRESLSWRLLAPARWVFDLVRVPTNPRQRPTDPLEAARAEVHELRQSLTWRATAPGRMAVDRLRRALGRP